MLKRLVLAITTLSLTGCMASFSMSDVSHFQPPITITVAPDHPLHAESIVLGMRNIKLAEMKPLVPAFNGQGKLLASWNPHPQGIENRPTVVVMHGGHGLVASNFWSAVWARRELKANVLILDSYWSRGIEENWKTSTKYGANMRMLDAIAAGRWLKEQGTDPTKTFIMGDSQGGWTVLRTFTDEPFQREHVKLLYAGGFALYPNCLIKSGERYLPQLGPYHSKILIFTGGQDSATDVTKCDQAVVRTPTADWTHFPEGTHAYDTADSMFSVPSERTMPMCGRAKNVYTPFRICRNDAATAATYRKIIEYVKAR